jgi:NadR type nicotinamide-nucleotide adenylyltransferase
MHYKKVVIIGPESTGKSSLSEALANHFRTLWCPEYAREYLLTNGKDYRFDDLLDIAHGQIMKEDQSIQELNDKSGEAMSNLLFIDTDMYVMKIWCEFVFGNCHLWILDQIAKRNYDLYLLCNTDLPWVKDELREYPDLETREKLFHIYKDHMINQNTSWVEIRGVDQQRLDMAIRAVEGLKG